MISKKELQEIKNKVKKHSYGFVSATGTISSHFLIKCFLEEIDKLFATQKDGVEVTNGN